MNRKLLIMLLVLTTRVGVAQQPGWKAVEGKITTPWAEKVNAALPLPEYPRPQMERGNWYNLNGLWDYTIAPKDDYAPSSFEGQILVPFAIESSLSGVGRTVGKDNRLWYRRTFVRPKTTRRDRVLLHFGAVDWKCEVYVNKKVVGSHEGGYDPFSFDITDALANGPQELMVSVWDPSDDGPQPRGKQVKTPKSIWYTPVTGIWQTVWLEVVPATYIESTYQVPDIDTKTLHVEGRLKGAQDGDHLKVSAWLDAKLVVETEFTGTSGTLAIPNPELWSPDKPTLYDLRVSLIRNKKVIDEVGSYFAMRKISMAPDQAGVQRMLFNNEFLFQYGPLDQGWWPDGLYTAPTDEALKFDIEKTKALGFNMIRKHVKVEPARWYYYCDLLGMLVWQDMPSGDMGNRWESRPGIIGKATDRERSMDSETIFKKEWKAIIDANINFPSIVVWVPFNEAWGQFKTKEIVQWTMAYDPSRLVNTASGGNFHPVGHIIDVHNYPEPVMPDPALFGRDRVIVLGEYGGLGLPLEGHTWQAKDNWGYQSFSNADELWERYADFIGRFESLIRIGLSAAVYTQTTDVEIETNGLMTYDRKVTKMPVDRLYNVHQKLYNKSLVNMK
jgi:beta-galactosidase/beta-glucuronidase